MPDQDQKNQDSQIIGTLKDIIFARDDFLIGRFAHEEKRGLFTALGKMMRPEPGLAYKLRGKWQTNPKFGKQLAFTFYEVLQPKDTEGIYRYLVRVAKWIGPTVAGRIVEKYGDASLEVLRQSPDRVAAEIKGITLERAREIQSCLAEYEITEAALVEIEKVLAPISGVPKNLGFDLVNKWGADAVTKLRDNPYGVTKLRGIGFVTADRIAVALGFDSKSPARAAAAISHVIGESMGVDGHVWVPAVEVENKVLALTGLDYRAGLQGMSEIVERGGCYARADADMDESAVAKMIVQIMHGEWRAKFKTARRGFDPNLQPVEGVEVDIIDEANESMDMHIKWRIEKARKAVAAGTLDPGTGPDECEDCGAKIPEGRRKAAPGCTRCISCQQEIEFLEKCAEPKHATII